MSSASRNHSPSLQIVANASHHAHCTITQLSTVYSLLISCHCLHCSLTTPLSRSSHYIYTVHPLKAPTCCDYCPTFGISVKKRLFLCVCLVKAGFKVIWIIWGNCINCELVFYHQYDVMSSVSLAFKRPVFPKTARNPSYKWLDDMWYGRSS